MSLTLRRAASRAVEKAVRQGRLPKIGTRYCFDCRAVEGLPCERADDYHHYAGYAPMNWLKVVPLCRRHHNERRTERGHELLPEHWTALHNARQGRRRSRHREINRRYHRAHREARLKYFREWYRRNRERLKAQRGAKRG